MLIKVHDPILNKTTKSGIILISPTDMDWNPDVHADRYGIVESVPQTLNTKWMMWKTEVEIRRGDLVWYDYLQSLNSDSLFVDEVEYKLMDYQFLYVAKRSKEIIGLNGYCLFEPKKDELKTNSDLILIHEGNDIRVAKMIYSGKPNLWYENEWVDDDSIREGDLAIFGMPPVMLEAEYHSLFEGKRQYRVSQRRFVYGYVRDGEIFPMSDCVIVKPDSRKVFTDGGLIIPKPHRKRTNYGEVYKSGGDFLKSGDRIHYHSTSATYIEHDGVEYGLLRMNKIFYKE